ncbi:Cytosolic Fe-S cluster assembly factor NARFL [Smittium mucronatum]|uniref:Cytosolic Fe-S cluster assembly factor NARFL n=1 Tax=Smittium mucronatum TaxID=133383 RepID=A0A1R0H3D0_9FUNG|nr:Cytosolic Fe-S cluster assembly factor NARFL [Smittium mucronatum]
MDFSSGVRLSQLNDFLLPEQDCIKPVTFKSKSQSKNSNSINVSQQGEYYEVSKEGEVSKLDEAQVNLADCLACSGCVTTAEAVLINLQSYEQILEKISSKKPDEIIVFTISPQTIASFSVKYNLSVSETKMYLSHYLKTCGVDYVFDLNFSRSVMQIEAAQEFINHKISGSTTPLISSWCPGVVCYAEKSQHNLVDCFSKVKSPMQIMGSFIKTRSSDSFMLFPAKNIYHVAVMPCFDKKLEASRPEFSSPGDPNSRLVDIVISTSELLSLFSKLNIDFSCSIPDSYPLASSQKNYPHSELDLFPHKSSHAGSAGGTLEFVLQAAAKSLYSLDIPISDLISPGNPNVEIKYTSRNKSKDYKEIIISDPNSSQKLVGVAVYGFRHLQTFIRKLKSKSCKHYDYVEVAACPGACANGGGQLKDITSVPSSDSKFKSQITNFTSLVESTYTDSDLSSLPSGDFQAISRQNLDLSLVPSDTNSDHVHPKYGTQLDHLVLNRESSEFKTFMYTKFHIVESDKDKLITSW